MSTTPPPAAVTLGTRASVLARAQTELVAAMLRLAWPGLELEQRVIDTAGDRSQASGEPLPEIGGKGLFTAELERALRDREIDFAVHSLKDLPTEEAEGIEIAAVTPREDPRDCLVTRGGEVLTELPAGAVVGTSSLRRAAQLLTVRPDLEVRSIRGNVDTRVRKVRDGELDAVVLAAAGVRRLGLDDAVSQWLPADAMLPAPGQGTLAIQSRAESSSLEIARALDHAGTRAEVTAERAFLRALDAGCSAPVGALATVTRTGMTPRVRLQGLVASVDGRDVVRVQGEGAPLEIGEELASDARERGADRILASIRG